MNVRLTILAAGLAATALAAPALATEHNGPAADGAYAVDGLPMGGFTLYPELTAGVGFDDNVLALNTGELDDTFYTLEPVLRLASNWSRHRLEIEVGGEFIWFSDLSTEDRDEFHVTANGAVELGAMTVLHLSGLYRMGTQDRGSPDDFGPVAEATEYDEFEGYAELRHRFNRLGVAIGGGATVSDFDDATVFAGGTLDNDARDHTTTRGMAEVNYSVSPDSRVFLRGTINAREYDQTPPAVFVDRNSDGYEVVGGFQFAQTEVIEGEIFAGYLEQNYDALNDIDGFSYGAMFDWHVTQLTTISVDAARTVEETNLVGASGYLRSMAEVSIRHELLRNLIVEAGGYIANDDFEGLTRNDDFWGLGVGVEYFLNRNVAFSVDFSTESKDSNLPGASYDRNIIWGGVTARF